jgi:phospholipid/cholesterol/gamma-HCH transport system substrate-binding protein
MEAKVNLAAVGAFVLLLAAALIAGVLWLSSPKSYRKAYTTYVVYMSESVSGLSIDAPVRYRGVEVGAVRRIALAPGNIEQVELKLDIERGTPIRSDTVAVLRTQGLTGIGHIELTGGSREAPQLEARPGEPYPVIRAGPSLMVRLDAAVSTLLANLNRSSEGLNALLAEDNRRALGETLAHLEELSRTLAARTRAIDQGLASAAHTMENAARVTAALPQLIERVERSAAAFERMSDEAARASMAVSSTMASMRAETRHVGETLPEARVLVGELRELTASLRRFSAQLERNPAVLIHGRPPAKPGPGE